MTEIDQLLREYVETGSEKAFTEVVVRHLNLVYSTALRRTGFDSHAAEDVTQQVFSDLAAKASGLAPGTILSGWLYRHTCFKAGQTLREQQRRAQREKIAHDMNPPERDPQVEWHRLAPLLDEAMQSLKSSDRDAILLRFFENHDLRTVGETLGINDDAAQKRVARAMDHLRLRLKRLGVASTADALAAAMASGAVGLAPTGLAGMVVKSSLSGVAGSAGVAALATRFMLISKLKIAGIVLLAVGIAATSYVIRFHSARPEPLPDSRTAPVGTFITNFCTVHFDGGGWTTEVAVNASQFQVTVKGNQTQAQTGKKWEASPGWFAYVLPGGHADRFSVWAYDGRDTCTYINTTPLGVSLVPLASSDETVPTVVWSRLPASARRNLPAQPSP